jgi:hypothetical protein
VHYRIAWRRRQLVQVQPVVVEIDSHRECIEVERLTQWRPDSGSLASSDMWIRDKTMAEKFGIAVPVGDREGLPAALNACRRLVPVLQSRPRTRLRPVLDGQLPEATKVRLVRGDEHESVHVGDRADLPIDERRRPT